MKIRSIEEVSLEEVKDVLHQIPLNENGFERSISDEDLNDNIKLQDWINKRINDSKGINLKEGYVKQTIYFLENDNKLVGYGKLRHELNDKLLKHGGSIGYSIVSEYRNQGLATNFLGLIIEKAKELNIDRLLFTVDANNISSIRVIEKNNGLLEKTELDDDRRLTKYY